MSHSPRPPEGAPGGRDNVPVRDEGAGADGIALIGAEDRGDPGESLRGAALTMASPAAFLTARKKTSMN